VHTKILKKIKNNSMPKSSKKSTPKPSFDSTAMRAFMERTLSGFGPGKPNNEQRARDLVYDAMEASTWEQRIRLTRQALDFDPENVDALLMMVNVTDIEGDEKIEALRTVVAAGARSLGKKAFKELVPHFWGFIETRPYMRARAQLAIALRDAGRLDEAASEFNEMLKLNEGDNQGMRYELLTVLLVLGRLDEARALFDRYPYDSESSMVFLWGRVLERVLSNDEAASADALTQARKQNAHVEAYLKGTRKLPKNLPYGYSFGSKEEAICFGDRLLMAWNAHPAAKAWIAKQPAKSSKK
jgi:tetratricopeptide (TPR) repeat protein